MFCFAPYSTILAINDLAIHLIYTNIKCTELLGVLIYFWINQLTENSL